MEDRDAEFKNQASACLNMSVGHMAKNISDMKGFSEFSWNLEGLNQF